MRKGDFIAIVQNPSQIKVEDIPALKSILNEFPYFSTAHALLAKAYYEDEHIGFQRQLRKAAAASIDRGRLHELLYGAGQTLAVEEVKKEQSLLRTSSAVVPKDVEEKEEPRVQKEVGEISKGVEESEKEKDILELQILSSAISSSILQEVIEHEADEIQQEEALPLTEVEEVKEDAFNEGVLHSFTAWLGHFSEDFTPREENLKPSLWKDTFKLSDQAKKDFGVSPQKKKQEFYSALKMAKLSVQEDDDLVTETLAKIYAAQENYEKAIQAYKKLQLKYPEKKVYFASQINALKNNLK